MRVSVINFGAPGRNTLRGLMFRFVVNGAGLWVAAALVPGIEIDDAASLLAATALFALVNTLVRPFAYLASACLIVLTFGSFIVVVNSLMLALTAWLAGQLDLGFRVDDFQSAILGALLIAFVSFGAYTFVRAARLG
jgi:putative membrane protein